VGQALPERGDEPARGGRRTGHVLQLSQGAWKTLRTTNTIERLHEEFRRRVKTQGSLPSEDAAVVLLFSLVVSGQIKLRIDGWQKIAVVLR
jgi:putative transposase